MRGALSTMNTLGQTAASDRWLPIPCSLTLSNLSMAVTFLTKQTSLV